MTTQGGAAGKVCSRGYTGARLEPKGLTMGLQFASARAISAVSTWGLKHVFRRPAANFPGKIALYVDPSLIGDLAPRLKKGSICVVGTNGKTTTANLLADALERAGQRVVCNRTGANLDSGVATALLQTTEADWGVFECDELWLAKILPYLKADYAVLLNLFRDQLDRVGEIDRIQDSIVKALKASPRTTVVYNADDPLCTAIAERAGNPAIAFGIAEDLHLPQNSVIDAQMCQRCSTMLHYDFRQYGQLGSYACPNCGFARPTLDCAAKNVAIGLEGLSFNAQGPHHDATITAPFSGTYMVYNLLAAWAAADLANVPATSLQQAIDAFDPQNGRLQEFVVGGCRTLLNLAKNPTGFNQNIKLIMQDEGPKAIAFFVNDKEGDGRDVSWLWDIDFEELAAQSHLRVFAGGIRKNDVQVRLKYAGLAAELVDTMSEVFDQLGDGACDLRVYAIANYTALPSVHSELSRMSEPSSNGTVDAATRAASQQVVVQNESESVCGESEQEIFEESSGETPLVIAHLFPDLLNLYGDGGNVKVLERRARDRGIPVEVRRVNYGETIDFKNVDLVFLGGGPDREQRLASEELSRMKDSFQAYVEDDGVLLAICGGYQLLGRTWLLNDEEVEGLSVVDMVTGRAPGGSGDRLIGNIALKSDLAMCPVVGYENHAGRTHLGVGVESFGAVVSATGHGNNDDDKHDGVRYRNVIGTYLHGPVLPKNPEVADALIARALERRARRSGTPVPDLSPLDDAVEKAANDYIRGQLSV